MAVFSFDKMDEYVSDGEGKINFLKLSNDGDYAKVRFMYGPGEVFQGESVHNVSQDPTRPRYASCLREAGQPVEVCPLCAQGSKVTCQFYIPVYVISTVTNVRGVETETPVGQVMLFQKGATFAAQIKSIVRQAGQRNVPIVNCVFNLVRNGKPGDTKTTYTTEFVTVDNVGLDQLPPRIEAKGSYILPDLDYNAMVEKYINNAPAQTAPADIQPRGGLNANTFAGNSVVNSTTQTQTFNQPMNNASQAPVQAPKIGSGNVPF